MSEVICSGVPKELAEEIEDMEAEIDAMEDTLDVDQVDLYL